MLVVFTPLIMSSIKIFHLLMVFILYYMSNVRMHFFSKRTAWMLRQTENLSYIGQFYNTVNATWKLLILQKTLCEFFCSPCLCFLGGCTTRGVFGQQLNWVGWNSLQILFSLMMSQTRTGASDERECIGSFSFWGKWGGRT